MSVLNAAATALYSKLTSGTPLTVGTAVYHLQAKEKAALPYVVFSLQAGGPLNISPSDLRDEVYFIRAYAAGALEAGSIDYSIGTLLHHGSVSVGSYTNYWLARETGLELVENPPNGAPVYMAGGFYRISLDS